MNLTIDRQTWMRGSGASRLLHGNTKQMCCLGFYALACGLAPDDIVDNGTVSTAVRHYETTPPEGLKWLYSEESAYPEYQGQKHATCTGAARSLMTLNDKRDLTEGDRERKIADAFAEHGVAVTFVN